MTIALCLSCGDTKFGAMCPCGTCGEAATGQFDLDVLFSDHQMPVHTLDAFGGLIKSLSARCDDPTLRFWAFLSYVSDHPSELMSVTPPAEIADAVADLIREVDLPLIDVEMRRRSQDDDRPCQSLALPSDWFNSYARVYPFDEVAKVQLRFHNGQTTKGFLGLQDGQPTLSYLGTTDPENLVAIRNAPGCMFGWLMRPKWVPR